MRYNEQNYSGLVLSIHLVAKNHRKQYKPVIYYGLYMILECLAALKAHVCVVSLADQCG